ncbi:MAG: hypothetical protein K0R39_3593 [Symbiobacteriaceae bacterium]|jgi:hypothetical protein|nr:hypothetical protein [Symbiobacteriaceae bacterium]
MQHPIREQIRLDGRWQARQIDENTVSVFVPGSWTDKRVLLRTGDGDAGVSVHLQPGQWNEVALPPGALAGARLAAGDDLRITRLQATAPGSRSLGIDVSLAGEVTGDAPCLLTLTFTLTAADGRRVGGMDLAVSNTNCNLSLEMPLTEPLTGPHRLKAALSCGERVADNARIDINQ